MWLEGLYGLTTQAHWFGSSRFQSLMNLSEPPVITTGLLPTMNVYNPLVEACCWGWGERERENRLLVLCYSTIIQSKTVAVYIVAITIPTLSVMEVNGWAGLAHSICRRVAVSMSQTDTSLLPLTAEMREDGWEGWGLSWYTLWMYAVRGGHL